MAWVDGFDPRHQADPHEALQSIREAHRYATRIRDAAEPGSLREAIWSAERKRLAKQYADVERYSR